jgi:hypothetical protein
VADSAYVIDIAANMPEAGSTSAELDALSASLIEAGASAESLEAATISVNASLIAARQASEAANAALADGNAKYGELERAAVSAAKAVERAKLKNGFAEDSQIAAMHEAQEALDSYADELASLEAASAGAVSQQEALARAQANLKTLSRGVTEATRAQAEATKAAAAVQDKARADATKAAKEQAAASDAVHRKSVKEAEGLVPLVKNYRDLGDALSTSEGQMVLAVGAAAGLAVAVAAVTVAAIAATVAIAAWAIGLADAKRQAQLTNEAAEALTPGLVELRGDFAALNAETGASSADLRAWTKQLDAAKVKAEDIPAALRAVALSSAALGQEGVGEFFDQLKDAKGEVGALAADVNSKLGGIVAKRMMGLDAQSAKLKKNFSGLFDDLNIEPVLEGMRILVDLFDKNTAAGEAIKFLFETIFQPLIDQATNAAYVVEAFALGFLIGMTKLYIKLKPVIKAVQEFFGFEDTGLADTLDIAKTAGELIAPVFVGIVALFGALFVAVGLAVAPFIALSAAAYALVGAVVAVGVAVLGGFMSAWQGVKDFFANLSLADIGTALIRGLAAGITGGASEVILAMVNVAKGAIKAAKSALGIASPSKELAEIGGFTATGFATGIDDGAGEAQDAMAAMVEPPAPSEIGYGALGASPAATGGTGGAVAGAGSSGGTVNIYGDIYFGGSKASKAEKEDLAEALTKMLEGDAASIAGESADAA